HRPQPFPDRPARPGRSRLSVPSVLQAHRPDDQARGCSTAGRRGGRGSTAWGDLARHVAQGSPGGEYGLLLPGLGTIAIAPSRSGVPVASPSVKASGKTGLPPYHPPLLPSDRSSVARLRRELRPPDPNESAGLLDRQPSGG